MLSARRDVSAARRFFRKLIRANHRRLPFTVGTDKHASYPEAFAASVKEKVLPPDCKLRRVKYLNNIIAQDHRALRRRRWRAMQCFRSFHTAERAIGGREREALVRHYSMFATQPLHALRRAVDLFVRCYNARQLRKRKYPLYPTSLATFI